MSVDMERSGYVTTIILNRPEVKNAVDGPTAAELARAFREFDADGDGVGDDCDTCPADWNPPERDVDCDGILEQFDLDGDGEGDICDPDPDGDNANLVYPEPDDYPNKVIISKSPGDPKVGDIKSPPREPVGDCTQFLWTLSVDNDNDRSCDVYNFAYKSSDGCHWIEKAPAQDHQAGVKAADHLGLSWTGMDFMKERATGEFFILECNAAAMFAGFSYRTGFDVPGALADLLLKLAQS